ncbi:MAG TPA: hypothetical protein VJ837_00035 [Candidatus Paceibacterota bacterium]|nr:hypothetical protein [Candidatus Paceibacterota bacterium]
MPEDAAAKRQQTTKTISKLYHGRLRLERRNKSPFIYARTHLQGKPLGKSTGETTLGAATKVATKWYLDLHQRVNSGEHLHGKLFSDAVDSFLTYVDQHRADEISDGQREQYSIKWNKLKPHFKDVKVTDVDTAFLVKLRDTLSQAKTQYGTLVKPTTLRKDFNFLSLVLKHARDIDKLIQNVPTFPSFRGKFSIAASPRPFFNYAEWTKLRNAAKKRYQEPDLNPRTKQQRLELYSLMMLCVGAALRVDEAYSVRWMDCKRVALDDKDKTEAIHMRVLGKHKGKKSGEREDAWAIYGGVSAYELLRKARPDVAPEDKLFMEHHRDGMKELLEATGLRKDTRTGKTRDAKSLRQTGISLRLELGKNVDIRDIAKWSRTHPDNIVRWYDQNNPANSVARIVGFRMTPARKASKKR